MSNFLKILCLKHPVEAFWNAKQEELEIKAEEERFKEYTNKSKRRKKKPKNGF